MRSLVHGMGYRFRLHVKNMPGSPDIVMRRYRTAIFVNGCFWHQHKGCRLASVPKTNTQYWEEKFRRTASRDHEARDRLQADGWSVLVIWECQTRDEGELRLLLSEVLPAKLPR